MSEKRRRKKIIKKAEYINSVNVVACHFYTASIEFYNIFECVDIDGSYLYSQFSLPFRVTERAYSQQYLPPYFLFLFSFISILFFISRSLLLLLTNVRERCVLYTHSCSVHSVAGSFFFFLSLTSYF